MRHANFGLAVANAAPEHVDTGTLPAGGVRADGALPSATGDACPPRPL